MWMLMGWCSMDREVQQGCWGAGGRGERITPLPPAPSPLCGVASRGTGYGT